MPRAKAKAGAAQATGTPNSESLPIVIRKTGLTMGGIVHLAGDVVYDADPKTVARIKAGTFKTQAGEVLAEIAKPEDIAAHPAPAPKPKKGKAAPPVKVAPKALKTEPDEESEPDDSADPDEKE